MKVGDYVRDITYGIGKITKIDKDMIYYETSQGETIDYNSIRFSIKEPKEEIIDLIEVGDYVNGVEVENIDDEWITMSDTKVPILKSIANGMIKSVITHEQMEQMAYKVGE